MSGRPSVVLLASLALGCAGPAREGTDATLRCEASPYAWLRRPHGGFPGITAAACDRLTHATFAVPLAIGDVEELRHVDVAGDGACRPFAPAGWPPGSCVSLVRDAVSESATILVYTPGPSGALALRHAETISSVEGAEVRVVPLFERAVPHLELVLSRDQSTEDELLLTWTREGWSPVLVTREIDEPTRVVRAGGRWEDALGPAPTRRRTHARFEERCSTDEAPCEHRSAETWDEALVWSEGAAAFVPANGAASRDETTAALLAVPPGRARMDLVARTPTEASPSPETRASRDDEPARGLLEAFEGDDPCAQLVRVSPASGLGACEEARALAVAPGDLPLRLDPDAFRLRRGLRAEPTGRCLPVRFGGWPETTCLVAGVSWAAGLGWLGVFVPTPEGHRLAHLHAQHVRSHFRVSLQPILADHRTLVVVDHWDGSGTGASFSSLSAFSMAPEGLRRVVYAPLRGLLRLGWERTDRSTLPRWEATTTDRPRLVLDHVRASRFCPEPTEEGRCPASSWAIAGWREVRAWDPRRGSFVTVERGKLPTAFTDEE